MIKTVIFDIGRVLIGFEWKDYVHQLFGNPEVEARVTDATFGSGIWNEMDRGIWSEEEVLARFIARAKSGSPLTGWDAVRSERSMPSRGLRI